MGVNSRLRGEYGAEIRKVGPTAPKDRILSETKKSLEGFQVGEICLMLQNYIIFYRNNELWKAKEKHGYYCSVQTRDEKGLD